jgi:hypothetical protein
MAVPVVNLSIDKGSTFTTNVKLKRDGAAIDLTGYTLSAKMRKHYNASTYYNFNVSAISPLSSGIVQIGMASTVTSALPVGRYVYDLLVTYTTGITTTTSKALEGTVIVKGTAT